MSQRDGEKGDEEGRGLGATIGGLLVLIIIVAVGFWLVDELAESARYSKCAAARHRNCDTIDYRAPNSQR